MTTPTSKGPLAASAHNKAAGRIIARARKDFTSLTQEELGAEVAKKLSLKVSQSAMSSWERGDRPVSAAVLIAVQQITGANIGDLATDESVRLAADAAEADRLVWVLAGLDGIPGLSAPENPREQQVADLVGELLELTHLKGDKEVAAAAAPELGASHEQIATALGISRARVTQMIKAVKLSDVASPTAQRARRPRAAEVPAEASAPVTTAPKGDKED